MTDTATTFERDRYVVLENLLSEPMLSQYYKYVCKLAESGLMGQDQQVPGTPSGSGDFMMDGLLTGLQPEIERASGLTLFPTYSYFRRYKTGDVLVRHSDRPACEVSVTLCLGFAADKPWPILIQGPNGTSSIEQYPGDALLYRGTECDHWREAFPGTHQAQVFLHYVNQHGPYTEWKFDKREATSELPGGLVRESWPQ